MKRRIQWIPVLVLLLLPLLAACGLNRFDAHGRSGLTKDGDVLYVASGEKGLLLALDLNRQGNEGVEIWRHQPSGDKQELGSIYGAPAFGSLVTKEGSGNSVVVVATYQDSEKDDDFDSNLFAFDAKTGKLNWPYSLPGRIVGSPTLINDTLLVGTTDGVLYALELNSNPNLSPEILWTTTAKTKGAIWSSPTVADGIVYFGTMGHYVYALNLEDGQSVWDTEAKVGGAVVGRPLVMGGTVYVGALDRKLYALDAATGKQKWEFSGDNWFWAAPVSDGRTIYAATLGGNVYAVDSGGNLLWREPAQLEGSIRATPSVVADSLIVGTKEGKLRKIRLSDGQVDPRFTPIGSDIRAALVEQDGVVYLIDNDGFVHAVDTEVMQEIWKPPFDTRQ